MRTELRAGNDAAAAAVLVRGLQDCKDVAGSGGVGALWAQHIALAPRAQRKGRMAECVRQSDDSADIFAAFGAQFAADRKFDIARRYFRRATALDGDVGDVWGLWIAAETADGQADSATEVLAAAQKVLIPPVVSAVLVTCSHMRCAQLLEQGQRASSHSSGRGTGPGTWSSTARQLIFVSVWCLCRMGQADVPCLGRDWLHPGVASVFTLPGCACDGTHDRSMPCVLLRDCRA